MAITGISGLDRIQTPQRDLNFPRSTFPRIMEESLKKMKAEGSGGAGEPDPPRTGIDKTGKLYEQCEALETFLIKNILAGMRKNVIKSDLLDTGFAGEIYEDMLWDEYSKEYSKKAGFGLAELAYLELTGQRGKKLAGAF
ncbi:MAG: rod-binding protein [Treponema sp.]|jgi:flagellar protein FlgJ|nr:rod-binding protein [Treponema sp.]